MPWTFPKAATCITLKLMENIIGKKYYPSIHFTYVPFYFHEIFPLLVLMQLPKLVV